MTRPDESSDRRIDRYFAGGNLLVDLGCGDGAWLDSVHTQYRNAIGIDVSPAGIDSRATRPDWRFVEADLNEGIPLHDGAADALHANQVIEHIANPLFFLEEASRVLRPGGVLVVTTPNIRYLRHVGRLVFNGRGPLTSGASVRSRTDWDDGHIHFFTAGDLEWLARTAGFAHQRTQALVDLYGRAQILRRMMDRLAATRLVKGFLSGNLMLVARR